MVIDMNGGRGEGGGGGKTILKELKWSRSEGSGEGMVKGIKWNEKGILYCSIAGSLIYTY